MYQQKPKFLSGSGSGSNATLERGVPPSLGSFPCGFAVDPDSLPSTLRVTHKSLFDHSIQGIAHIDRPAFGFQGHPEASPGPHDAAPLFDHFIALIIQHTEAKAN